MPTTTITSKGQITLPKAVRDRLALKEGDRLRVAVECNGRVTLERDERPPLDAAYGLLRRLAGRRPVSIAQMNQAIRRRARAKHTKRQA